MVTYPHGRITLPRESERLDNRELSLFRPRSGPVTACAYLRPMSSHQNYLSDEFGPYVA